MNVAKFFIFFTTFCLFLPLSAKEKAEHSQLEVKKILSFTIDSSINPATFDFIRSAYERAEQEDFQLLLMRLNTPGGLVTTTKDILTLIGKHEIPFVVWVTPEGASATSAGAIIASGAHLLYMSEGTNIGAATPIQMSGDIKQEDLRKKAINDLVALVQSLSEARGRNAKLFGEMIEKASSFKAQEAQKKKLINGITNNQKQLVEAMNNAVVHVKGKDLKLNSSHAVVIEHEMDLGQKVLNLLANPSLAYILFLLGAALLYLELQAPGGMIAGALGALCLLLAGISFQVLPLNIGALVLIGLSFVLFVLEIYVTSFGILSLAGIAALVIGSLFLYRTDDSYLQLSTSLIASVVSSIVAFMAIVVFVFLKDLRRHKDTVANRMIGKTGRVTEALGQDAQGSHLYQVKVGGELWKAKSQTAHEIDDQCEVLGQDREGLTLII